MIPSFVLFIALLAAPAHADRWNPTFGAELEFTNSSLYEKDRDTERYLKRIVNFFKKHCANRRECRVYLTREEDWRVIYKDGLGFTLTTDPGTIEIKVGPYTLHEFRRHETAIQSRIFDVMADEFGLLPEKLGGGAGHIHIGRRSLAPKAHPHLIRDFWVDFTNHHEIASGVLDMDLLNAASFAIWPTRAKNDAIRATERRDRRALSNKDWEDRINAIYKKHHPVHEFSGAKFSALNLQHDATLEIRSIRMHRNASELVRTMEIFRSRLDYLRRRRGRVPVGSWVEYETDAEMAQAFKTYLEESGLRYEDYSDILLDEYRVDASSSACRKQVLRKIVPRRKARGRAKTGD